MNLIPKSLKNAVKNWGASFMTESDVNILAASHGSGSNLSEEINNRMPPISRKKIDDWTQALNAKRTERPSRVLMTAIHERVMMDDAVKRGMNKRDARIKGSRFKLENEAGESQLEAKAKFEKEWFMKFLGFSMKHQYTGQKVIEINKLDENREVKKIKLLHDNNVDPWRKVVLKDTYGEESYDYTKPPLSPYYIEVGDEDSEPIMDIIAPLVIYKSLVMHIWVDYAHKYGVPPRVLEQKGADKNRLKELEKMMKNMIASNWAIIKEQEKLHIFEPKNATGSKDVFDGILDRIDAAIFGLMIGQNGTVEASATGTYGSLKVMADVSEEVHAMDKLMLHFLINDKLIPRLIDFGYPLQGLTFKWDDFQELSPDKIIDAVSKLSTHYEFDIDELVNLTGLPITKLRRLPGEDFGGSGNADGLGKFEARMRALYPGHVHTGEICGSGTKPIAIAMSGDVPTSIIESIIRGVFDGKVDANQLDAALATNIGDQLYDGATEAFDFNDIAWNAPDNLLASKLRDNLYAFSAAKSYAQMRQMGALLVDENNLVRSFADFKAEAMKVANIHNVTWLETEYNNAVASGQMAAQWNRYQVDKDLLPLLQFDTAGDERVRDSHAQLDGVVKPLDDPFWDRNYPPLDHNCRCDVSASSDFTRITNGNPVIEVDPAFQSNVGKSGIVYTNAHPYYQTLPQAPTSLSAVRNYGMRKASAIMADPKKLPYVPPKDFNDYWKGEDFKQFQDHNKLSIRADKSVFDNSPRANRIAQTLQMPSEVWTNERTTRYMKYYEDGVAIIEVNSDMTATGWKWYELDEANVIDSIRTGILIKR